MMDEEMYNPNYFDAEWISLEKIKNGTLLDLYCLIHVLFMLCNLYLFLLAGLFSGYPKWDQTIAVCWSKKKL